MPNNLEFTNQKPSINLYQVEHGLVLAKKIILTNFSLLINSIPETIPLLELIIIQDYKLKKIISLNSYLKSKMFGVLNEIILLGPSKNLVLEIINSDLSMEIPISMSWELIDIIE
jgi:hypothetical protein